MTTQTNTPATPVASLTKKELFAIFAKTTIEKRRSYGASSTIIIDEYMRDGGSEGYAQDEADRLTDEILNDDDPFFRLEQEIDDRKSHLQSLKLVYNEFIAFKAFHELGEDENREERYRVPSRSAEALAHPPLGAGKPDGVDLLDVAKDERPSWFDSEEEGAAFVEWLAAASDEGVSAAFDQAR